MSKVNLQADLITAASAVTVTASHEAGGQLLTVDASAYDVTICVPVAPVRIKWRIGQSGDWREVEGGECFTVEGPDAANVYLAKGAAQSIPVEAAVKVRTIGEISVGKANSGVVTYKTDPLSGGSVFSGVGLTFDDASKLNYLIGNAPVKFHVFGNSIMAGGVFDSICDKSGGYLVVVQNSAVGGTNSDQVLQRMKDAGFNKDAHAVVFMEGANDAAQNFTVARHASNMQAMIDIVRASGKIPVMVKAGPTGNAYQALLDKMAFADHVVAKRNRVALLDIFQSISSPSGGFLAGCSDDMVHPSSYGAGVAAHSGVQDFLSRRPPQHYLRAQSGVGLFPNNATMLTDSTSDGLPDGWASASGANTTFALSAAAYPAVGNKCTVTTTSSTAPPILFRELGTVPHAGDVVRVIGAIRIVSDSAYSANLKCNFREMKGAGGHADTSIYSTTSPTSGLLYFEKDIIIGADTNGCYILIEINRAGDSAARASTFEFVGIDAYNLTALGVA